MKAMRNYLNEPLVGLIAPAGFGKTEEIVNAVNDCCGKQLILTHTRAGVAALRERMRKNKVDREKFEIDTIASFCLKWCKAYPTTAAIKIPAKISEINYLQLYEGAKKIFTHKWAREVLQETYSGLFVDEYQDCTELQHQLFMSLQNLFPIRIFGDPLQGIFYWVKDDRIVDWHSFSFKIKEPLTVPWRWRNTNWQLGCLLNTLRDKLKPVLDGVSVTINLSNYLNCITMLSSEQWNNGQFVYRIKEFSSVVYLTRYHSKQVSLSQRLGGFYQCDETQEWGDTEKFVDKIENEHNAKKALALITSLKDIITGIRIELKSYIKNLENGKCDFHRISKYKELGNLLKVVCEEDSVSSVLDVLQWLENSGTFKIYRKEFFWRIKRVYKYMLDEGVSADKAIETLSTQRFSNEKSIPFSRLSSRTVLTKGLEFDYVIIDLREKFDARDFYVAMTRAKKYIYIISDEKQITFEGIHE